MKDSKEKNILHEAALKGFRDIIEWGIVEKKMNAQEKDSTGALPFHYSVKGNHLELCKRFVELGVDPGVTDKASATGSLLHFLLNVSIFKSQIFYKKKPRNALWS